MVGLVADLVKGEIYPLGNGGELGRVLVELRQDADGRRLVAARDCDEDIFVELLGRKLVDALLVRDDDIVAVAHLNAANAFTLATDYTVDGCAICGLEARVHDKIIDDGADALLPLASHYPEIVPAALESVAYDEGEPVVAKAGDAVAVVLPAVEGLEQDLVGLERATAGEEGGFHLESGRDVERGPHADEQVVHIVRFLSLAGNGAGEDQEQRKDEEKSFLHG